MSMREGRSDESPLTVYGVMFSEIEDVVNSISTPREYSENIETAKRYLKSIVHKYNNVRQTEETWESDFQKENKVSDKVMEAINATIYEASTDTYNKPSLANRILSAIEVGVNEALVKEKIRKVLHN